MVLTAKLCCLIAGSIDLEIFSGQIKEKMSPFCLQLGNRYPLNKTGLNPKGLSTVQHCPAVARKCQKNLVKVGFTIQRNRYSVYRESVWRYKMLF